LQNIDKQSLSPWQVLVSAQAGQVGPPQSTSVSSPSFMPLVQEAGGIAHIMATQRALTQSAATLQAEPIAQGMQSPPQSTPVSRPFFTPSLQVGMAHLPMPQKFVAQLASVVHWSPKHPGHGPPQSTPVSMPSLRPFPQVSGKHTPDAPQVREVQSALVAHIVPLEQVWRSLHVDCAETHPGWPSAPVAHVMLVDAQFCERSHVPSSPHCWMTGPLQRLLPL
jgi:hypothetical protein